MIWMGRVVLAALVLGLGVLPARAQPRVELSFYGGAFAGGQLFRASSEDAKNWPTPDGRSVLGTEIRTELDEFIGGGVRVKVRLKPQLGVALGAGFADMDVGGTVRRGVGSIQDTFSFDQALVFVTDLTAHYDLLPRGHRPYVLAGLGWVVIDGGGSFDQSGVGLSLGFGYRLRDLGGLNFDLEARDTIMSLDAGGEAGRLGAEEFTTPSRAHVWQLTAAWVFLF